MTGSCLCCASNPAEDARSGWCNSCLRFGPFRAAVADALYRATTLDELRTVITEDILPYVDFQDD